MRSILATLKILPAEIAILISPGRDPSFNFYRNNLKSYQIFICTLIYIIDYNHTPDNTHKDINVVSLYSPGYTHKDINVVSLYTPDYTQKLTNVVSLYTPDYTRKDLNVVSLYTPDYTHKDLNVVSFYTPDYTHKDINVVLLLHDSAMHIKL